MLSIQIRSYNPDLSFRETISLSDATPEIIKYTAELIGQESASQTVPKAIYTVRRPYNFCNMMIRENGKLVSYRKFM